MKTLVINTHEDWVTAAQTASAHSRRAFNTAVYLRPDDTEVTTSHWTIRPGSYLHQPYAAYQTSNRATDTAGLREMARGWKKNYNAASVAYRGMLLHEDASRLHGLYAGGILDPHGHYYDSSKAHELAAKYAAREAGLGGESYLYHRMFRNAIQENQENEGHRLIYADWLDEHNLPDQAQSMRLNSKGEFRRTRGSVKHYISAVLRNRFGADKHTPVTVTQLDHEPYRSYMFNKKRGTLVASLGWLHKHGHIPLLEAPGWNLYDRDRIGTGRPNYFPGYGNTNRIDRRDEPGE